MGAVIYLVVAMSAAKSSSVEPGHLPPDASDAASMDSRHKPSLAPYPTESESSRIAREVRGLEVELDAARIADAQSTTTLLLSKRLIDDYWNATDGRALLTEYVQRRIDRRELEDARNAVARQRRLEHIAEWESARLLGLVAGAENNAELARSYAENVHTSREAPDAIRARAGWEVAFWWSQSHDADRCIRACRDVIDEFSGSNDPEVVKYREAARQQMAYYQLGK